MGLTPPEIVDCWPHVGQGSGGQTNIPIMRQSTLDFLIQLTKKTFYLRRTFFRRDEIEIEKML